MLLFYYLTAFNVSTTFNPTKVDWKPPSTATASLSLSLSQQTQKTKRKTRERVLCLRQCVCARVCSRQQERRQRQSAQYLYIEPSLQAHEFCGPHNADAPGPPLGPKINNIWQLPRVLNSESWKSTQRLGANKRSIAKACGDTISLGKHQPNWTRS